MLWNDARGTEFVDRAPGVLPDLAEITGVGSMTSFTAAKLDWLARHEPATFAAIRRILLSKDFVRLTGPHPVEPSPASFLRSAAPVAVPAEAPTIALFGSAPKGGKKACMLPPMPALTAFFRMKISASRPKRRKFPGRSLLPPRWVLTVSRSAPPSCSAISVA